MKHSRKLLILSSMKLYIGADHQGFHLKEKMTAYLVKHGYEVEDVGDKELDPQDDFPQIAAAAAMRVLAENEADEARAILICGGGQGVAMAANRFRGIRAAVIWDAYEAKMTRNDNDCNVLCLPARLLDNDNEPWKQIVDTWIETPFADAPRYRRRNLELDTL